MQNARLSELEKVLAKTSAKPSPSKMSAALKSSEELNSLKEENRVVSSTSDILVCTTTMAISTFLDRLWRTRSAYGGNGCSPVSSGWI